MDERHALERAAPPAPATVEELSAEERAALRAWRAGRLGPPSGGPSPLSLAAAAVLLLLALVLLGALALLASLLGTASGLSNDLGRQARGAADLVTRAAGGALQQAVDLADPAHPPREALAYDTQFAALELLRPDGELDGSAQYRLTLKEVRRRPEAADPRLAGYAVFEQAYRQPRDQRILGLKVGTDTGAQERYAYTGESFRVGHTLYKVNWVSVADQHVALVTYRDPDSFGGPLRFELD